MATDDPPQNQDAKTGDISDDFLAPLSDDRDSRTADLREDDQPWNICRDFIDPMVHKLEEWLRKPERSLDDIEDLTYFAVGVEGMGPDACVSARNRAKLRLDVNVSVAFRTPLEREIRALAEESRDLRDRLRGLASDDDGVSWRDVYIQDFEVRVVEPFLEYLQNTSRVLQERLPREGSAAGAETASGGGPS